MFFTRLHAVSQRRKALKYREMEQGTESKREEGGRQKERERETERERERERERGQIKKTFT